LKATDKVGGSLLTFPGTQGKRGRNSAASGAIEANSPAWWKKLFGEDDDEG